MQSGVSSHAIYALITRFIYIELLSVRDLPSGLLTPHATPLFFNMSNSEETSVRSSGNDGVLDPSVGAAIQSPVSASMGSLAGNLTQVIENLGLAISRSVFPKRTSRPLTSSQESSVRTIYLQKER